MQFSPGYFGSMFTRSGAWTAQVSDGGFECRRRDGAAIVPVEHIARVHCKTGMVWAQIEIDFEGETLELRGLTNRRARQLAGMLVACASEALLAQFEPYREDLARVWQSYAAFLNAPRFLSHSDLKMWGCAHAGAWIMAVQNLLAHPFLSHYGIANELVDRAVILLAALRGDSGILGERNEAFAQQEMAACGDFFDAVESTPLTDEQRRASVVMEDRNLLVASAGSGKTSTVVGKVGYALLRKLVAPEEILVVVFNAHAAKEIEARVGERLKLVSPIKVKTFHALGLEIIGEVEGARPRVAEGVVIGEIIDEMLTTDAEFAWSWAQFLAWYADEVRDPVAFATPDDWLAFVRASGEYENGRYGFRTLNGDLVGTQGERAIANYLFMHGVGYECGRSCEFYAAKGQVRQYTPAFYVPVANVYLEQVVADAQGRSPAAFAVKYRDFQAWKRALGEGEGVIETRFSEFASGALFSRLERELVDRGLVLRRLSAGAVLKKIPAQQQADGAGLVEAFVKHARSNQMALEDLETRAQAHSGRALMFVRIAARVMQRYAERLKESGAIDFEDMVLKAARYARERRYRHGFRLILVDEFQDISRARADLLLGLLKHAPECKLFAVGDDWQSIYRFAGSDISLFTGFESHFGKTAIAYLTQTFRSNQGIAEVAAHFVQQNPAQMKKTVTAADQSRKGVLVVRRYQRRGEVARCVAACLEEIAREANGLKTVYLLGRYRHQAPEALADWEARYREILEIEYKTMHGSKGLQADYVVVLGLQSGGFPSERTDDPLLHLVMPKPECHPHAEERRLFYVALTRARHRVYLLGSKRVPSRFMTELIHKNPVVAPMLRFADEMDEIGGKACPECGAGTLRLRTGKHGAFYGCSAFPACRYTAKG